MPPCISPYGHRDNTTLIVLSIPNFGPVPISRKPKTPPPTYAERVEYLYWVRELTHPAADDSDVAVSTRSGLSVAWIQKWKARTDAPPGRDALEAYAQAMECSWEWLAGREGALPPLPALWRDWFAGKRGKPVAASDPRYITGEPDMIDPARDRHLTEDELDRADAEVARLRDEKLKRGRGGK